MNKKTNATTYNFIAFIIGWALSNSLSSYQQDALGNWLQLLGQYLETTSAVEQIPTNNNSFNNNFSNIPISYELFDENMINELIKNMELIKKELEKLQKKNK